MQPILATQINTVSPPRQRKIGFLELAKSYAGIIDSRESTYRTALDITGFCLPIMGAAAFRNTWSFLEATFESVIDCLMVYIAPQTTTFVGKILSKKILPEEEQKDYFHYLGFLRSDLENLDALKQGVKRIEQEEIKDKERIAELYKKTGNEKKANHFLNRAKETQDFCKRFTISEDKRQNIQKLKKSVILGESLLESIIWGFKGLFIRLFRKHILRQDRFTGTLGYLSDSESATLGEGSEISLIQKIGIGVATVISPIINAFFLKKIEKPDNVKNSKFYTIVNDQIDMTHSVYPKLGLLFTYLQVPELLGMISTSQGKYEILERILRYCAGIPSWWCGHRVTNGLMAKIADERLQKEFNKTGILVEPQKRDKNSLWDRLCDYFPEPARIQHVLDRTEGNKDLQEKAVDLHAKTLYGGFALHSFLIWVLMMGVNALTKLRVMRTLKN